MEANNLELRHLYANLFEVNLGNIPWAFEPKEKYMPTPKLIGRTRNGKIYWTEEGESILDGFRKREISRLLKNRDGSEILVFPSNPENYRLVLVDMVLALDKTEKYYFDPRYSLNPKELKEPQNIPSYTGGPFC